MRSSEERRAFLKDMQAKKILSDKVGKRIVELRKAHGDGKK
jgi:hypothetical protein